MPGDWSEEEWDWFDRARRGARKFLCKLDDAHFVPRAPIIAVCCSDYRRNYDMIAHVARVRGFKPGEDHQTHRLCWHGGIMRIVPTSATNSALLQSYDVFLAELLEAAYDITKLREFVAIVHWPCGKGKKHGLRAMDAVKHLMDAKYILKGVDRDFKVKTLFHVDPPDWASMNGMKTYFVDPDAYMDFVAAA